MAFFNNYNNEMVYLPAEETHMIYQNTEEYANESRIRYNILTQISSFGCGGSNLETTIQVDQRNTFVDFIFCRKTR